MFTVSVASHSIMPCCLGWTGCCFQSIIALCEHYAVTIFLVLEVYFRRMDAGICCQSKQASWDYSVFGWESQRSVEATPQSPHKQRYYCCAVLYTYNLTLALFCDQTIDASNRVTRYHGWNSMLRFLSDAHRSANNVSHLTGEDEQLDEERDLIIKEIEKLVRLSV